MKYLVLGSSGQIGECLCSFLERRGQEVLRFDIVEDEAQDLRIRNNDLLIQRIKDCDFIFFLAFDVGGSRYLSKYQKEYGFLENNVRLMCNTFELIKEYNKKFIFASSQMSNMDYSPYGVAKSLGERYTESLGGLVVKFWNVYGPEKDLEKSHVITDFILKAMNDGEIDMLTDGSEVRQFLHADDCSNCLHILSEHYDDLSREDDYHITSFKWNSILEIAEIIASSFPDTKVTPSTAKDTVQKDKRNEPNEHILKFWKPEISIREGIEMIIKEMKEQK
jgi:nucleoside-diphosphate-sugar epimerase